MIDLQIQYDSSSAAPTDDATQILVDGSLSFLSNYAVGAAGFRKGDDEIAARCKQAAVGPRYDVGVIGGQLYRLIQPLVRSLQNVQVANRPFSAARRMSRGIRTPFIGANPGVGGTTQISTQFSTADGTITGTIDGVNTLFYLSLGGVTSAIVYLNGLTMTEGVDYTRVTNEITFLSGSIPQTGDTVTADVTFLPS